MHCILTIFQYNSHFAMLIAHKTFLKYHNWYNLLFSYRPNSPAPLTDDWKVTDDSSVNFHDVFFFIFCYNLAKNEEKHIMEIYGWVVRNFPVIRKWTRWIWPWSISSFERTLSKLVPTKVYLLLFQKVQKVIRRVVCIQFSKLGMDDCGLSRLLSQ